MLPEPQAQCIYIIYDIIYGRVAAGACLRVDPGGVARARWDTGLCSIPANANPSPGPLRQVLLRHRHACSANRMLLPSACPHARPPLPGLPTLAWRPTSLPGAPSCMQNRVLALELQGLAERWQAMDVEVRCVIVIGIYIG